MRWIYLSLAVLFGGFTIYVANNSDPKRRTQNIQACAAGAIVNLAIFLTITGTKRMAVRRRSRQ